VTREGRLVSAYGATLLRIILGVIFVMHGYYTLVVLTPERAAAFMNRAMGLPFSSVLVWYLIAAHLVGGALLVLGIYTRWAALVNIPIMLCAVFLYHIHQGFFMKGVGGQAQGYEYALLVLVATVAQVLLGGGALALKNR
jgi:putative oxidoreductase